jgi:hypothetical protein
VESVNIEINVPIGILMHNNEDILNGLAIIARKFLPRKSRIFLQLEQRMPQML